MKTPSRTTEFMKLARSLNSSSTGGAPTGRECRTISPAFSCSSNILRFFFAYAVLWALFTCLTLKSRNYTSEMSRIIAEIHDDEPSDLFKIQPSNPDIFDENWKSSRIFVEIHDDEPSDFLKNQE